MKPICLVPAVCVMVIGCSPLHPDVTPENLAKCGPRPSQAQAEEYARTWASQALADPFSAVVRDVTVVGPSQNYRGLVNGGGYDFGWTIAFLVNAKNAYGGYAGFQPQKIILTPDGKIRW